MSHVAFISHSSIDKVTADEICRFLERHRINCWIAPRDVTPGKNYGAAIIDAIDECDIFVLILSSASNDSGQVVREVERASSSNSIIIPFRVEDVHPSRDLEFYVSAAHWLDATQPPLSTHLQKLLRAIQSWQQSGPSHRKTHTTPSAASGLTKPATAMNPPAAFGWRLPLMIGAIAVALILIALFFYRRPVAPVRPSVAETMPSKPNAAAAASGLPDSSAWEIVASSQHDNHAASMAFDGNDSSSWVTDTDGIGQTIKVNFKTPISLTSISIVNGNAKDPEHYQANNRPSSLRLRWNDGASQVISLEDKMTIQHFHLQHRAPTGSIALEILSIYPGTRNNWSAISEISFNQAP